MINKINVVFPCAGKAERFGNTFKPFMKIGDLTFIEKAIEPFLEWRSRINKFYFIITDEQETQYNVSEKMHLMFQGVDIEMCFLKKQTNGPLETFVQGFVNNVSDDLPFIVCDCDHSIGVDPLFKKLVNSPEEIIIPTWPITPQIQKNWSKILIKNNNIAKFVNKEDVDFNQYDVKGIIGCIFFRSKNLFKTVKQGQTNFYELIFDHFLDRKSIALCDIESAYFYGDFDMLEDCVEKRRGECTIFCDIDGVLLEHNDHSSNDHNLNVCLKGYNALRDLHNDGHKIVLTTARNKKFKLQLQNLLDFKNIYYDELLMSCRSGPRVLINDRKPKKPFTVQSTGLEFYRNEGLSRLEVDSIVCNNSIKIIKDISSNSFAKTYVLEKDGDMFVRKNISKSLGDKHVSILKRQKKDVERFNFLKNGLCPQVISEGENSLEYYYDMEFLSDHSMLSDLDNATQIKYFRKTIQLLEDSAYSLSKQIDGAQWLNEFLQEKIYPKFSSFSLTNNYFDAIINEDEITINGKKFVGLKKCMQMINKNELTPDKICVVHGDLTLENIMVNEKNEDVKLIDMDGSRLFDARELDLGKLSQSIVSRYGEWKHLDGESLVSYGETGIFKVNSNYFDMAESDILSEMFSLWSKLLGNSLECIKKKSIFYMCTYFIRFVPFRMAVHLNHGVFALLMSTVWLNKLLGDKDEN